MNTSAASVLPKQAYLRCAKISVSMPQVMRDQATLRARALGYPTFSDYLQAVLRADLRQQGLSA